MITAAASPSLLLTPIRAAAPNQGTFEVLVRVQAPAQPETELTRVRAPVRLAMVIDRSGSMSGEPLHEALRCAEYIASRLLPTDQLGIVLYDDHVRVALPLSAAGNEKAVQAALAGVESGGSTALFDGWQAGAEMLAGPFGASVSRVLLLSDGQANQGLRDPLQIGLHCAQRAVAGITTTTVGLGRHFNEDLMISMARAGGGQNYYGQTAEDLHDSFNEELSLLQALYMRQLRVKLIPAAGVIAEPLGVVQPCGEGTYSLPDLAFGAEAWMLVRLHIAKAGADPRAAQALLAVTLEGTLHDGDMAATANAMLSLPVVNGSDLAALPADPLVLQRLKEVDFSQAAGRIAGMVDAGDVAGARALLATLAAQVADHPWLSDKVRQLETLVQQDVLMAAKEFKYSQMKSSRRLTSQSEALYSGSETAREDIPLFLRRKDSEGQGRKRPE